MKTRYFKSLLFMAGFLTGALSLQSQTLREENQKEYTTNSASTLKIENQFGNITVTDWDQNKVVITYIIEVTATPESKAKKLMEQIKIEFSEGGNEIFAKTRIGKDGELNMKNDRGEKQSFKIDYHIKCPKNIPISLSNQFGDVSVSSLTGKTDLSIQFGSLNAVSLTGAETSIDLQFGKATIGELKNASIDLQHSDMFKITSVSSLEIEAQFCTLSIGTVNKMDAEFANCNSDIEKLTGSLTLEANMGSTTVKNVAPGFTLIEIEQNMGDIKLTMDPKAGYKLSAAATMSEISVPSGFNAEKNEKEHVPGVTNKKVSGTFGDGSGKIKIDMTMGSIKLK